MYTCLCNTCRFVIKLLMSIMYTYYIPISTARDKESVAILGIAMAGRCFLALALHSTFQMCLEIFPTTIRGRGVAIASAIGVGTSFGSSFIIHSVSEIKSLVLALEVTQVT